MAATKSLILRKIDDDIILRLKQRAARHGRSAEEEHRQILRAALSSEIEPNFLELALELRKLTKGRKHTPSEVLQKEGREER